MKTIERVITFDHESPVDTGCGKVYYLASTDPIAYTLPITASFELALQSGPGELHQHRISHETYIGIEGEGFISWGTHNKCTIKAGDVINIIPGTLHALNAFPGTLVTVLVVSYPRFSEYDLYPVVDTAQKRKEEKPSFFLSSAPTYGLLIAHDHIEISRILIQQPYFASGVELLFVISGKGTFKTGTQKAAITTYDSMTMEKGDSITPAANEPIYAIAVRIKA